MDTNLLFVLGWPARISNKDTFERLIIKFVSERTQVMNKANTTKNTRRNRKDRGESGFNT